MALDYDRLHQRGGSTTSTTSTTIPPAIQALQNLLNGLQAGELLTGDGNGNPVVVPIGTDGQVLTPDSTSPTGFSYQGSPAQQSAATEALSGLIEIATPVSYTHLTLPTIYSV